MSTFTDWNGPQGSNNLPVSKLAELISAYSELVAQFNAHVNKSASESENVHNVRDYINTKVAAIEAKIPSLTEYVTKSEAGTEYARKEHTHDEYALASALSNLVSTNDLNTILTAYLKTEDLDDNKVISSIQSDIDTLKEALNKATDANENENFVFEMPVLKATKHIEGILKSAQLLIEPKRVAAVVGGANNVGVFYILGMLDDTVGTAFIKYSNNDNFSAIVNFTEGALSVTTDCELAGLKFFIIECSGHKYLAIQSSEWISNFASTDGVGKFNSITFNVGGINFVPADAADTNYHIPNGNCTVKCAWAKNIVGEIYRSEGNKYLTADDITALNDTGAIISWSKFDPDTFIATDVPKGYAPCDGKEGRPLVDCCIIKVTEGLVV